MENEIFKTKILTLKEACKEQKSYCVANYDFGGFITDDAKSAVNINLITDAIKIGANCPIKLKECDLYFDKCNAAINDLIKEYKVEK